MELFVSGHGVSPLLPFIAAYVVASIMLTAGISGAFLLLPFQVSVLGFVGPAVTPTNHLYNVLAIPAGVYRYVREGRMLWPLTSIIVMGTVPGVIAGSFIRIYVLATPAHFKLFVGCVLLLLGARLSVGLTARPSPVLASVAADTGASNAAKGMRVVTQRFDWRRFEYEFLGERYGVSSWQLALLTTGVGVLGGAYGVGGGAIIAPFLVSIFGLPVHTIAGATLLGSCLTSVIGVLFFTLANPLLGVGSVGPHWALGIALGAGGLLGTYTGARLQKHMPARAIQAVLALATTGLALSYIAGFFV